MEPVTHFLTGACLARSGFNRKAAYATLAMTLAAEAPDLDVFWAFRGPVAGFEHHRGITHTFIAAPFIALITVAVVWMIHKIRKKPPQAPVRWGLLWCFALIAHLSHLLLDFTNNYGLRPFFPFNPRWYSWDIVFIFEPLMFAALLLALVLPWFFGLADREIGAKRVKFRGRGWAIAAFVFIALLYTVRNAEHAHAINLVRNSSVINAPILRVSAEPEPINPFLWQAIIETADFYQRAAVHTRSDQIELDPSEDVFYKPPVTMATLAAKRSLLGRVYLDWAQWPVVEDKGAMPPPGYNIDPPDPNWHTVQFRDLRFDYPVLTRKASDSILSGWVYVGPQNEIEGMFMSGKEQKD
ncbi:metal-dependent hydrolase [Alloacidobacterium dinghuense]|uniref:Metal-dependent hydrolase n=1 Tax=Alloacidobacterium dinghuense TaxID=2763107 RepID=A0A7G8BFQ2_9BACT|nr:metal-dependent hydrolase [Alloacidobacterium dinghuense]QNI31372.1 metal-dependent hydrolase [Alloacidobacterium dinghuense]